MDHHRLSELNETPFGRNLQLLTHRLPRTCKAGQDWELERGFHLNVLGEDFFEFTLAPRGNPVAVPFLCDSPEGLTRFLVWHCPGKYSPERFPEFAAALGDSPNFGIGLILSHSSEHRQALLDYPKHRRVWKKIKQPVIQVFQDFPRANFFAVEKSLFCLGRIGRRVVRLGKLRRLMPW